MSQKCTWNLMYPFDTEAEPSSHSLIPLNTLPFGFSLVMETPDGTLALDAYSFRWWKGSRCWVTQIVTQIGVPALSRHNSLSKHWMKIRCIQLKSLRKDKFTDIWKVGIVPLMKLYEGPKVPRSRVPMAVSRRMEPNVPCLLGPVEFYVTWYIDFYRRLES